MFTRIRAAYRAFDDTAGALGWAWSAFCVMFPVTAAGLVALVAAETLYFWTNFGLLGVVAAAVVTFFLVCASLALLADFRRYLAARVPPETAGHAEKVAGVPQPPHAGLHPPKFKSPTQQANFEDAVFRLAAELDKTAGEMVRLAQIEPTSLMNTISSDPIRVIELLDRISSFWQEGHKALIERNFAKPYPEFASELASIEPPNSGVAWRRFQVALSDMRLAVGMVKDATGDLREQARHNAYTRANEFVAARGDMEGWIGQYNQRIGGSKTKN